MDMYKKRFLNFIRLGICLLFISCNNNKDLKEKQLVKNPEQMNKAAGDYIHQALDFALNNKGKVDDSIHLYLSSITNNFYNGNDYTPVWSNKEKWMPLVDSLMLYMARSKEDGLYPNDYHTKFLQSLKTSLDADSIKRKDAVLWAKADLMLTDGLLHIMKDLKEGRLQPDSLTLNKDSVIDENFFTSKLKELTQQRQLNLLLSSLQPKHKGYWQLKNSIKSFLDSMDTKKYTYINYPYKKGDKKDSVYFIKTLQKRLKEGNYFVLADQKPDSIQLANALKKYQKQKGLKVDGKISTALIRQLNTTDLERFKRIAITLDRYKQLPPEMPQKYIWVNLPGFYLWVIDHDTIAIESKIICGKPDTRTPLLTSEISDMVTYPTWTVPNSIIAKEMLPGLKRSSGYLARKGFSLFNYKGEEIDPSTINWAKYKRAIPFKIRQGSGDANALGIYKFNFNNKYSVYLHDTNQRYLFKNSSRALSHGCVRVQEWEKLAFYIARNDSMFSQRPDALHYNTDSIKNWIANKERHRIDVRIHIPLYIRYFTCEGKKGKIHFYDDFYNEDKILEEKYFADK